MNDEKIILIARLKVKDDAIEEGKRLAFGIVEDSRTEEGCVNYDVHQAIDDETVFVWHETWKDKNALDEHFEKNYFKEFFAKVGEIAAEKPQITLTKMITEKV